MGLKDIVSRVHTTAKRGHEMSSVTGGYYGGIGPLGNLFGGTNQSGIDFAKEAGRRTDSSIARAIIEFARRNIAAIPLEVYRLSGSGKGEIIPNHPITQLLRRPNPWYPGSAAQGLQIMGEMSWGNSYCLKHRSDAGLLIGLEVLPTFTCYPFTWPGRGDFVSEYRVGTAFGYRAYAPSEILHIRYELDDEYPVIGSSPLESCFPEIVADKKAQRHQASILDNGAVSTAFVSPKMLQAKEDESVVLEFSRENAKQLESRMREKMAGDAKGSPFVATVPFDVNQLGWSPDALNVEHTTSNAESRICAVMGFHPAVIPFLIGMKESNNRASLKAALEYTFNQGILPMSRSRCEWMTLDLIPELGRPGEVIQYDESKIPILIESLTDTLIAGVAAGIIAPDEARVELGRPKAGGVYSVPYPPKGAGAQESEESGAKKPNPKTNGVLSHA